MQISTLSSDRCHFTARPQKFLGPGLLPGETPDGAQAFMVPLLFGTTVTPVRGVGLPGFGEITVPVAQGAGDSEVRTPADKRNVYNGGLVLNCDWRNVGATPLASYNSDDALAESDEQYFPRVATGSRDGHEMSKPKAVSHLPGQSEFDAFPAAVASCLADEQPSLPAGDPCPPQVDDGEPPKAELCIYSDGFGLADILGMPWPGFPLNICGNVPAYAATIQGDAAQQQCATSLLQFLCAPVSKVQTFDFSQVVARVWNLDVGMNEQLHPILQQCADAYLPPGTPDAAAMAKSLLEDLISVKACSANATLIPDSELFQPMSPGTPPSPKPGKACVQ